LIQKGPSAKQRAAGTGILAARILAPGILARIALGFCVASVGLLARPATAADLAILSNGFWIRHDHRAVMGATTRLYLSADNSSYIDEPTADITGYEKDLSVASPQIADSQVPAGAPSEQLAKTGPTTSASSKSNSSKFVPAVPLNDVVNSASAAYHLDPDLVNSVIHAESGFNAHAVSPKGARGLMQLMPDTANKLGVNDSFDSQANVDGGSRYLRELLERYNFDLVKALAAYNAGPQRVDQYRGVPPFRETRAYVARIVHEYNRKIIAQEKEAKKKQAAISTKQASASTKQSSNPTQASNSTKVASRAHSAAKPASTTVAAKTTP
jgi:hypothetical protein